MLLRSEQLARFAGSAGRAFHVKHKQWLFRGAAYVEDERSERITFPCPAHHDRAIMQYTEASDYARLVGPLDLASLNRHLQPAPF